MLCRAHEPLAVVARLGNRRRLTLGRVEHAVRPIAESTAVGRHVRERRHDVPGAGTDDTLATRHQRQIADFVPKPWVEGRFDRVHRFEILGVGDALEQVDRRKDTRDDAYGILPVHPANRQRLVR